MMLSIYWIDRGTHESRSSDFWRAGFASALLALIHPYLLPFLFAFVILVTIVRQQVRGIAYLCCYFAASLPFAIYECLLSIINPIAAKHSGLGEMKSPPLVAYGLGFGFPLLMFVIGLIADRGRFAKRYWQIALWFFLCLALAYLPVWFQRKLVFGAQIPLSIIGGLGFAWILAKSSSNVTRRLLPIASVIVLVPLLSATPVHLLVQQDKEVKENIDEAYFVKEELIDGLKVLRAVSNPNDVVFAEPATSRLIPAFSGNTTIWGHWAMSVDYENRRRWIESFLHPQPVWDDETRAREFWGSDIQFIFADKQFKQSLDEPSAIWRAVLKNAEKIFENRSVVIYRRPRSL